MSGAVFAASSGDTIAVLPGTHWGANIDQDADLASLRITSIEGPDATVVSQYCFKITGGTHDPGQIWIDGFTIRDCGPSGSLVDQGWGVYVSTFHDAEVRIQDNVFEGVFGRGAVGLESGTAGTRFHAVVARNRFSEHHGEASALNISLPADSGEDYCIRVENNVIENSDSAIGLFYLRFRDGDGKFELANNTLYGNAVGILVSSPAGAHTFVNNILFNNAEDFNLAAEMPAPFDVRSNLVGSGQFSGLNGNFAADPLFEDAEAGNYRLRDASPAADRGDLGGTALEDIAGTRRTDPPDLGAYERTERAGERLDGLRCGDGIVQSGLVSTSQGQFVGFETCEDGNTRNGDGCSSLCQFEPGPPRGQISLKGGHLCVIRGDGSLTCWGEDEESLPVGSFRQVALSAYHGCALGDDGAPSCWRFPGSTAAFEPAGSFAQIDGDYYQTCGLREDGSITCWDDEGITIDEPGPFERVDTNYRACGLSAAGDPSCFEPYVGFPSGPFVHVLPANNTAGCALRPTGEVVCLPDATFFMTSAPRAGLAQVRADDTRGCGLRPDGSAVYWHAPGVRLLLREEAFLEVVPGFTFCCGLTLDRRAWCSENTYGLPAE